MTVSILTGDCRELLPTLESESVQCVVTSPPYWGLRDYGVDTQIGLEGSPAEYVDSLVSVFREVWRALRADGTVWLNLGDCYATAGGAGYQGKNGNRADRRFTQESLRHSSRRVHGRPRVNGPGEPQKGSEFDTPIAQPNRAPLDGLKPKDLCMIPARVALALQADGWWLRSDIIWSKPNPMPESVTDRPTKSHEYLFLLSKSARYHYDAAAILEPISAASIERLSQPTLDQQAGSERAHAGGKTNGTMKAVARRSGNKERKLSEDAVGRDGAGAHLGRSIPWEGVTRNRRSVWTVTTQPFKGAHFATFPPKLIEPCVLAGTRPGDVVLDPFGGAGTTGLVADRLGRNAILIELNETYAAMARERIDGDAPLFAEGA